MSVFCRNLFHRGATPIFWLVSPSCSLLFLYFPEENDNENTDCHARECEVWAVQSLVKAEVSGTFLPGWELYTGGIVLRRGTELLLFSHQIFLWWHKTKTTGLFGNVGSKCYEVWGTIRWIVFENQDALFSQIKRQSVSGYLGLWLKTMGRNHIRSHQSREVETSQ